MTPPPRPNLRLTLPEILVPGEVAKLFGITTKHLSRHDAVLKPFMTVGGPGHGHRRYRRDVVVDVYEARQQERRP